MNRYVLDTSAVMRLYIPDGPIPPAMAPAITAARAGLATLSSPELLLVEVGHVLRKKEAQGILSASEASEILSAVLELPIRLESHRALIQPAVLLSRKHRLSTYDGVFLALAQANSAQLITADDALGRAAAAGA